MTGETCADQLGRRRPRSRPRCAICGAISRSSSGSSCWSARRVRRHRPSGRRHGEGPAAVRSDAPPAVRAVSVRYRPAGPRSPGRHGGRHSADPAHRVHRGCDRRGPRGGARLHVGVLPGHGGRGDPGRRGRRLDRARAPGADHHRGVDQGGPDRRPDGPGRGVPGVAEPDARHPRPGLEPPRARLRGRGPAQRDERAGDHRPGARAEPPAVSRRDARERRVQRQFSPACSSRFSGWGRSIRQPSA